MTEIATIETTSLALEPDQTYFTDGQIKALQHIGVENAAPGDLQVFHHVCQRTGLDPFARQIYMIGRKSSRQVSGQWVDEWKQTIQTGIDGFRLIGRRAADAAKHKVSVGAPEWAHHETGWQELWIRSWGLPVAARVTIMRDGQPFTAVALFDEYKQTKSGGALTKMWEQRPAGQLAKCAEALAWRMAFPQDLSGLYVDEEMQQADTIHGEVVERRGLGAALAAEDSDPDPGPVVGPQSPDPSKTGEDEASGSEPDDGARMLTNRTNLGKAFYARVAERKFDSDQERIEYLSETVGRLITSSKELTEAEARQVLSRLDDEEDGITDADEVTS